MKNYRIAHDIALRNSGDETSTEELRTALLHYRIFLNIYSQGMQQNLKTKK